MHKLFTKWVIAGFCMLPFALRAQMFDAERDHAALCGTILRQGGDLP